MKARIFSKPGILCLIFLLPLLKAGAQEEEVRKAYHEEYKTTPCTRLFLDNKYGDITIRDWEKKLLTIDAEVVVEHPDEDRAGKLLDYIHVEFERQGNDIMVETVIDSKFSKSDSWFRGNSREFHIHYRVNMPRDLSIDVSNKYGGVFINEITGTANIAVKYGKLTANRIGKGKEKPYNTVTLGYSDGSIEECNWLEVAIKYSNLSIDKSRALIMVSKYSKIFVGEGSSMVCELKYDTYELGTLDNFVASAGYGNIRIGELQKQLEMESRYTDCRIDYIPAGFKKISIENKYGGYKMGIDPDASYYLDGEAEYAKIHYPDQGRVSRIEDNHTLKVSGNVGQESNPASVVSIRTKYGNIRLDR